MEDKAIHISLIDDVKFDVSEIKRQLGDIREDEPTTKAGKDRMENEGGKDDTSGNKSSKDYNTTDNWVITSSL